MLADNARTEFNLKQGGNVASIFELATLSAMAYDATKITFAGWVRIDKYGDFTGKGFYAELYLNSKRKEVVIAIRGTDGGDKDWSDFQSDIQIGLGRAPSQIKYAEEAYKKFLRRAETEFRLDYNLYLTGRSLGGGLASLLSAKKAGLPTITFNAPGMQRSYIGGHLINIIGHISLSYVDTSQMLHVRATGDPVSKGIGKHMGKVQEVYVDHWGDGKIFGSSRHLAQHSIENMVLTMKTKFWCQKDLGFKVKRVLSA